MGKKMRCSKSGEKGGRMKCKVPSEQWSMKKKTRRNSSVVIAVSGFDGQNHLQ
jgi:hypothetical protein